MRENPFLKILESRVSKFNKILAWAKANDSVKVLLQTSSLTNPNVPKDMLSDLDIELVVSNLEEFLFDNKWLTGFGKIIHKISENPKAFDNQYAMRMVFYEDYVKVDFRIYSLEQFNTQINRNYLFEDWDIGYKVWIDKNNLTGHLSPPTYRAFIIKKPTKNEFENVLNDFWWDVTYVVKSLWRGELFYAKYISESVLRFENLQKILEWYIGSEYEWKVTTNKYGRLFKKYLPAEIWGKIEATFSGSDIDENWKALLVFTQIIREIGMRLALKLGYEYPLEVDKKINKYIKDVMSAREINL